MSEEQPAEAKKKRVVPTRTSVVRLHAVRRTGERAALHADAIGGGAGERGAALVQACDELEELYKQRSDLQFKTAALTEQITQRLDAAEEERGKIIKLAEANLPKGDPIIKALRSRE
jgi:hypothetical protein